MDTSTGRAFDRLTAGAVRWSLSFLDHEPRAIRFERIRITVMSRIKMMSKIKVWILECVRRSEAQSPLWFGEDVPEVFVTLPIQSGDFAALHPRTP